MQLVEAFHRRAELLETLIKLSHYYGREWISKVLFFFDVKFINETLQAIEGDTIPAAFAVHHVHLVTFLS